MVKQDRKPDFLQPNEGRPTQTDWMNAEQKVSKAGRRDIVAEFGTVPPKAGRLRFTLWIAISRYLVC